MGPFKPLPLILSHQVIKEIGVDHIERYRIYLIVDEVDKKFPSIIQFGSIHVLNNSQYEENQCSYK